MISMAQPKVDVLQNIIDAKPGERVTYWSGHLAYSCDVGTKLQRNAADMARAEALDAMSRGFCFLVQVPNYGPDAPRIEMEAFRKEHGFSYVAIRSRKGYDNEVRHAG